MDEQILEAIMSGDENALLKAVVDAHYSESVAEAVVDDRRGALVMD